MLETLAKEESLLDTWINFLKNSRDESSSITSEQLRSLLEKDSALLAIHLPRNTVVRTIHLPAEFDKPFAFKLSVPHTDSGGSVFLPTYVLRKDHVPMKLLSSPSSVNSDVGKENVPNRDLKRADHKRDFPPFQKLVYDIPTEHSASGTKEGKVQFEDDHFFSQHSDRLLDQTHVLEERCNSILTGGNDSEESTSLNSFETLLHASSLCM